MDEPTAYCGPPENDDGDRKYSCRCGTDGPVQGGGDTEAVGDCGCGRHKKRPGSHHAHDCPRFYCRTEPELDVPERLGDTYRTLVQANFPHLAKAVADAIVEIKRLESELGIEQEFKAQAIEARNTAQAQLRAITDAKPVKWEYRHKSWAPSDGWEPTTEQHYEEIRTDPRPNYEVRKVVYVYAVAPPGDTEDVE